MVSKEFLYNECVNHHHCIHLILAKQIMYKGQCVMDLYLMGFNLSQSETEKMIENIIMKIDTYGIINVKVYAEGESPTEPTNVTISTNNIAEYEMVSSR